MPTALQTRDSRSRRMDCEVKALEDLTRLSLEEPSDSSQSSIAECGKENINVVFIGHVGTIRASRC